MGTVDGVMGGHSSGEFRRRHDRTCQGSLLSGEIELAHGGFVAVSSPPLPKGLLRYADGVRVCTKATRDYGARDGRGDLYKVRLRSGRLTYQADFHTAEAGSPDANVGDHCDGVISTLPFSHFWRARRSRAPGEQDTLDPTTITSVGFDLSFLARDGTQNPELVHAQSATTPTHSDCVCS